MNNSKYNFESEKNDYLTPNEIIEQVFSRIGQKSFSVDVCCSFKNIPASFHYINGLVDGLANDWRNFLCREFEWAYCNPPFDECGKWVKKAHEEQQKGNKSVLLIPARTETKFWHDYILDDEGFGFRDGVEVQFLRKGTCFLDSATGEKIKMKQAVKGSFDENGDQVYKYVDGVYKNPLALVYFGEIKKGAGNGLS